MLWLKRKWASFLFAEALIFAIAFAAYLVCKADGGFKYMHEGELNHHALLKYAVFVHLGSPTQHDVMPIKDASNATTMLHLSTALFFRLLVVSA